nr:unnamed protein product [Callosobruchus analis]
MSARINHSDIIIDFLISEAFAEIIKCNIENECRTLKEEIQELRREVTILKESNIDMIDLLVNKGLHLDSLKNKEHTIINNPVNNARIAPREPSISERSSEGSKKGGEGSRVSYNKNQNKRTTSAVGQGQNRNELSANPLRSSAAEKSVEDGANNGENSDEWKYPRRRNRTRNVIYGKANSEEVFKGVVKFVDYHVFRCSLNLSAEGLKDYLKKNGVQNSRCEEMKSKYPDLYKSFKVSVPEDMVTIFKNPNIWPQHVGIDRNIDYEKISYALIGSDWRYDSVDTNEVFNNFLNRMTSALNETCLLIYKNVKFNHKAWFNDTTKTAIYNKKLAYHRFKMDKTANNWQIYQRERNICLSVLRKAKSKYYEEKIDNARSSSTSMWETLKSIVSTKSSAVIETVLVNNTEYTENLENIFNNFFIESIDVIVQASKANNKMFVFNEELMFTKVCSNYSSITLAQFNRVTLLELRKLIFQQKNKNSVDEINFEMLKATFQVIGYPLLHILNTSLDTGIFPNVMKTSVVHPIAKVAGTKKLDEFRPINMLPNTEKVLELIVHRQVTEHIDKNKLININQSGFREGFSCETALRRVLNDFKISLDNGHILVAVFIDLRRAFETVNRTILLSKLAVYFGFDGKVLNWFSSYLSDRRQTTKINQQLSNSVNVDIGVPKGSVLGPLLFILYINDIFSVNIHQCRLHLFADDIVLYSSDSNFSQLVERINTALENLNKWFDENQLTVNTKKSKFMVITNRLSTETVISVKMKNEQLERVSEIKYLGILIDKI